MFHKIKCTNIYWLHTVGFGFTVSFPNNFLLLVHLHFVFFFFFFSNKKYVHEPYPKIKKEKSNIVDWNWKPHMLNLKRVVYAKQKQLKQLLKTHSYRCLLTQSTCMHWHNEKTHNRQHGRPQTTTDYQSKLHAWTTFTFYPHQTFSHFKATTTCMDHHKQRPTTNSTYSNTCTFSSINLQNIQIQHLNKVYINPTHNRQKI